METVMIGKIVVGCISVVVIFMSVILCLMSENRRDRLTALVFGVLVAISAQRFCISLDTVGDILEHEAKQEEVRIQNQEQDLRPKRIEIPKLG